MERKSIGSFIAALRRAKGLTQRQLAELLNVSDKAVSRWERDECAPDLSLIPVIAELFGVTCDELLRGERTATNMSESDSALDAGSAKGQKQLKYLLRRQLISFRNRSLIAAGIALAGLVTALICNFCFYRAALGGLLSFLFYGAAAICEAIFLNQSALNKEDEEAFDTALLADYRAQRINCAKLIYLLIVLLTVICLPLLWIPNYTGLLFNWELLLWILGLALIAVLLFVGGWRYIVCPLLIRQGNLTESETATDVLTGEQRKFVKRWLLISGSILAVTVIALIAWNAMVQPADLASPIEFEEFDSFKAFMELPVMEDMELSVMADGVEVIELPEGDPAVGETDIDESPEQITDREGNVLCEFYQRNHSVVYVNFDDENILPVQVITRNALQKAAALHQTVYTFLGWLTVIELITGILIGCIGVRKMKKQTVKKSF